MSNSSITTADALRQDLGEAFAQLRAAIDAAGPTWARACLPPDGSGRGWTQWAGPDAWSPRQAAEHVLGTAGWYTGYLSHVLAEAQARSIRDFGGRPEPPSCATSADAGAVLDAEAEHAAAVAAEVADEDLDRAVQLAPMQLEYNADQGRPAENTLAGVLHLMAAHLRDHAAQIGQAARQ